MIHGSLKLWRQQSYKILLVSMCSILCLKKGYFNWHNKTERNR